MKFRPLLWEGEWSEGQRATIHHERLADVHRGLEQMDASKDDKHAFFERAQRGDPIVLLELAGGGRVHVQYMDYDFKAVLPLDWLQVLTNADQLLAIYHSELLATHI